MSESKITFTLINPKIGTDTCYREWYDDPEDSYWFCVNDITSCIYNDGHNACCHEGCHSSPLEEDEISENS